jgi:hypothetical protein
MQVGGASTRAQLDNDPSPDTGIRVELAWARLIEPSRRADLIYGKWFPMVLQREMLNGLG